MTQVVIIGGQAAGMSAAAKARRVAPDVAITVFEQSDIVSFGACGLPYFIAGEFSDPTYMTEFTPEDFNKRQIDVCTHHRILEVKPKSKEVVVQNKQNNHRFTMHYDRLLIATGARPITPAITGIDLPGVYTLHTLNDGLALQHTLQHKSIRHVTLIGAGFISLELAEGLVRQGKSVRIFQRSSHILANHFDSEISAQLILALQKQSVELRLNETISLLQGTPQVEAVWTDKARYTTDCVVICAGVAPNTDFLHTLTINRLENGALVTDHYGKTSLNDIYAVGDCATVPHSLTGKPIYSALATVANKFGRWIGENMVGQPRPFPGTLGSAAIRLFDLEAARTGLSATQAQAAGFNARTKIIKDKNHTRYVPGQAELTVKLTYEANTQRILGAQMVGETGVVHRLNALAVAITKGMTTEELGMLDFCYAPPFSRVWDILNVAGNAAK